MAPLPVSQKFLPESKALRHGVQDGALTEALVKRTPSLGQFIEIRGLGQVVDATCALDLGINGSLPSPVVGKSEKNIRSFYLITTKRFQGKDKTNCKDSIEHKGFRVKEQKPTNSKQSIGVFLFGRTKVQMKHYSDAD